MSKIDQNYITKTKTSKFLVLRIENFPKKEKKKTLVQSASSHLQFFMNFLTFANFTFMPKGKFYMIILLGI
jgi:hypothetical protein